MQTTNSINSLAALGKSPTQLIVAENIAVTKLEPGQQLQATIQEQVSPGLYKVQVAGQIMQMQLPGQLKAGNQAMLQVVSTSPRLTFSVVADNNPPAKLEPGQQMLAAIQEQVSPGLYKVQVAGQIMQMQLPGQLKVGNQITLQVISTSPRLSFSVLASSTPISTAEEISSTSRLLSNLAQLPISRTFVESTSGHAVWPSAQTGPEIGKLAVGLKDALANSGLFYESHQAQWVAGIRSTAQLLIEPQNQLIRTTQPENPAPASGARTVTESATLPITKSDSVMATVAISDSITATASTAASGADSVLPIAKELVPLVQQQLHTLETHQLTWSGQIWPGQQMQWEVQGEPEHRTTQSDDRQWSTEMELALPRLGDVHARLVFNQGGVKLTLHAADGSATTLFNRRLPELAASMKNAGIALSGAVVEKS